MADQVRYAEAAMSSRSFFEYAHPIAIRSPYPWEAMQHIHKGIEAMARRVIWC